MPIAKVQMPDGRIGRFEVPEGATEQDILRFAESVSVPAPKAPAAEATLAQRAARVAGRTLRAGIKGATALPVMAGDALNAGLNVPIAASNEFLGTNVKPFEMLSAARDRALSPVPGPGTAAERILDTGAEALASLPTGAALGAAKSLAPMAENLGTQAGTAISGGLATGAASELTDNPLWRIAAGLAGGAAYVPLSMAAGKLGGGIGNLADLLLPEKPFPIYGKIAIPSGPQRLIDKFHARNIGDKYIPQVRDALENAETLVPGSAPTAAEAVAGIPGGSPISAMQKVTAQTPGGISGDFGTRIAAQRAARSGIVDAIAGTDEQLAAAMANRTKQTAPLYSAVDESTRKVDVRPVMEKLLGILSRNQNETDVTRPLTEVFKGMQTRGDMETSPMALASLSRQIKKLMTTTVDQKPAYDVKALGEIKAALDKQIGLAEPNYTAARSLYKTLSAPINRQETARVLADKLVPPTGQEAPGTFLRALDDAPRLLKKATGFSRYDKLEDVFTAEQAASLRAVAADLERKLASLTPTQRTEIGAANNLGLSQTPTAPQLLSQPIALLNAGVRHLGRDIEPKLDALMASQYLNPKQLAATLHTTPAKAERMRPLIAAIPSIIAAGSVNPLIPENGR